MGNTIVVLDTETIGIKNSWCYDISWGVLKRNKIIAIKSYLVKELLGEVPTGDFSADKFKDTMSDIAENRTVIKSAHEIFEELLEDLEEAKFVYAYNANFDRGHLIKTAEHLKLFETAEDLTALDAKWRDLWAWASNTILYKKSFIDFCEENNLITPKGYCSTSADTCLKYIYQDMKYSEKHIALYDVLDEIQIYLTIKEAVKSECKTMLDLENSGFFKGKPFYTIEKLKKAMNS